MSERDGGDDRRVVRPPSAEEVQLSSRLRDLSHRLDGQRAVREAAERPGRGDTRGAAQALRMSTEFVAGTLVGAAFGWGFDWLLGTSPWGLIVFLLFGFAAGVFNVLRSAGLMREQRLPPPGSGDAGS